MKHSEMLNLNLPEDSDLINVSQISDNFERLDGMVDILPVQQETTTTDIDITAYPPYWSMTNNTDSNITYVDHKFFDEEFVIEPGQTIRTDIDTPTEISISSEVTIDYVYYIPAKDAFSGGGSGGTSDYDKLSNQPKINGVKLTGDKSAADLGLASVSDLSDKISSDEKGASNGIATLDADGKVPQSQLPTPVAQKEYKLTETTSESYAKSYKLQVKDGETWSDVSESASINIPKDMVVESGSVKECTTDNVPVSGYKKGDKYIDLVIANKADAHIYINVKDLVDNKASGISYSNTTSKLTATTVQAALDEIAGLIKANAGAISDINESLDDNKTELLSSVSTIYKRYGCKSLWSIDERIMNAAGYIYGSTWNIPAGNYKLCIKSPVAATMQLNLSAGYVTKLTKTFNATVGSNEVSFELAEDITFIQLYTQKPGIYTEIAIIPEDAPAEPYVPYAPTNRELQTNLLSTIVASSNASATNSKTLEFQGTGKAVEKLVVEGKTVQDGTPSPSVPVDVKGVGDRYEIGNIDTNGNYVINTTGNRCRSCGGITIPNGTYVVETTSNYQVMGFLYDISGKFLRYLVSSAWKSSPWEFTLTEKSIVKIMVRKADDSNIIISDNLPITIKEKTSGVIYSFPYKIPISVAGKSQNVYLDEPLFDGEILDTESGSVDKKWINYTFTGDETWNIYALGGTNTERFTFSPLTTIGGNAVSNEVYSNCLPYNSSSTLDSPHCRMGSTNNSQLQVFVPKSIATTAEQMKAWVKQMYNNGTPLVIAYKSTPVPTKETFDAPEISTVVGKNTLTVGTEVTPAKVEVTSFGEYYSKAEVDKKFNEWITTDITSYTGSNFAEFFKTSESRVLAYYNSTLKRVVIELIGVTIKDITNMDVSIAQLPESYRPKVGIRNSWVNRTSNYTAMLSKNNTNNVVAFSAMSGTIPSGSTITGAIEWQLF